MTTYDNPELEHLQQKLEWAEQAFQRYTSEYEKAERRYQNIITERRKRNCTAGDYCDWSEFGTKTRHSLDMHRHRASDLCFSSRRDRNKAKKELDDYMASIVVPCAEAPDTTADDGEVQDDTVPPPTTCCPGATVPLRHLL